MSKYKELNTLANKEKIILNQVKKEGSVVYGARAIKAHLKFAARPTRDFDIHSKTPVKSAMNLRKTLNRRAGGKKFYDVKSRYYGKTRKVIYVGLDGKKQTRDDVGIADITPFPNRKIKIVSLNGVNYVSLADVKYDKRKSLKDKRFKFRHNKDREDLNRINNYEEATKW